VLNVSESVLGVNSEVGALRVVILHRPGPELQRLTPQNNDALLFDGLPWVARAQQEHDAFADVLRSRGVEVLLLSDLLVEALASGAAGARERGSHAFPCDHRLGRRSRLCGGPGERAGLINGGQQLYAPIGEDHLAILLQPELRPKAGW